MIDSEKLRLGLDVVQFLLWVGLGLYVWASNRHRATRAQIERLRDHHDSRLDNHGDRLTKAEETLRHLPDGNSFHELSVQIAEMRGDIKGLDTKMDGQEKLYDKVARQVELVDEFLKKQKPR